MEELELCGELQVVSHTVFTILLTTVGAGTTG